MAKPKVVYRVTFLVTDRNLEPIAKKDLKATLGRELNYCMEVGDNSTEPLVVSKLQVDDVN